MADHETVKIVDEEQPLLASDPEQLKSCGPGKKTISSCDKFTRVVFVGLIILNFVQWRISVMEHNDAQTDECLQTQGTLLQLQERVQGLCMDRAALLKSFEEASLPTTSAKIEHEAISEAFETLQKVLAEQNELNSERVDPQQVILTRLQQELHSVCDIVAF